MDSIRDTHRTGQQAGLIEGQDVRTNPFGGNRAAERVYRRAERIAAGVYVLTNHISSSEPTRIHARETAASMLNDALDLRDQMRTQFSRAVIDLQSRIRYLISLVRIMAVSGFISEANASVVIEALDELGNFISASQRSPLSERISLTREDLTDARIQSSRTTARDLKDTPFVKDIKDEKDIGTHRDMSKKIGPAENGQLTVRVQNIFEILRTGGPLGIKDISAHLPEYSEKMIQRELLDLVSRGAVRKTGLKRWSKYSLPTQ